MLCKVSTVDKSGENMLQLICMRWCSIIFKLGKDLESATNFTCNQTDNHRGVTPSTGSRNKVSSKVRADWMIERHIFHFPPTRIQSKVLYPPISPTQRWVSGPRILRAFHPLPRNFPLPSSAPPSTRCPLWSLTHHWAGGIRPPPRRRTLWEASQHTEKTSRGWRPAVWTHCLSTLFLVSKAREESLCAFQLQ